MSTAYFVSHPEVEPTNWEAERAVRPAVVNRKVWGGNRTWVGAQAQEVLMSVLETCRRAGRSGLEFVSQTVRAFANPLFPRPILLTPRSSSPTPGPALRRLGGEPRPSYRTKPRRARRHRSGAAFA